MINLLPEQEKRDFAREYRRRLSIVIAAFCVGAITISLVLLMPSYLLAIYQQQTAADQNAAAGKAAVGQSTDLLSQVVSLRSMVSALDASAKNQKLQPTAVLATIIKDKPSGDSVSSFTTTISATTMAVVVTGTAKTRESLVAFTEALKRESSILSVDLPISNLASDTNIKFIVTVTAKT